MHDANADATRVSHLEQTVVDAPNSKKSDMRRARSALVNLAPTSTGSATAIALIFPGECGMSGVVRL